MRLSWVAFAIDSRWDATWLGVTEDQLWVGGFCAAPRQRVRLQHFHFVGLEEGSTSLVQAWDVEGSVTSGNSCVCSLVDGTAKAVVCFIYSGCMLPTGVSASGSSASDGNVNLFATQLHLNVPSDWSLIFLST